MAVWRPTFFDLGGFDVALGPGTPTCSGEDLDLFLKFVESGWRILYEHAALTWHYHRRDSAALRDQVHSYGIGLSALFTKWAMLGPPYTAEIGRLAPTAVSAFLRPSSDKNAKKSRNYPVDLTARELAGVLRGPGAYVRSRHREARARA
jgi:GT2 family glycosyltransferase